MRGDVTKDDKPNPYFLGFSIGVGIGLTVLITFRWFPWIWDEKYQQLRDFLFFSAIFFIVIVRRYWTVSRVPRFWLALVVFGVVHSMGFWLLISRVRDLRAIEFILITIVELFPAVFFINWLARVRVSGEGTPESID
jgi:hypothetical protein